MEIPSNTKPKYSKIIVALVIFLNIIFASAVLINSFLNASDVPEALIISWFAFTGTELLSLAGIKITELKNTNDEEDSNEEQEEITDELE